LTSYNLYGSKDDLFLFAVDKLLEGLHEEGEKLSKSDLNAITKLIDIEYQQIVVTPRYADAMTRTLLRLLALVIF